MGSGPAAGSNRLIYRCQQAGHIRWQGAVKVKGCAGYGVRKRQTGRMQGLARQSAQDGQSVPADGVRHLACPLGPAIDRIADNAMPDMGHMHTDLCVRPVSSRHSLQPKGGKSRKVV